VSRSKVLLVSADTVGPSMAGPGIRYWELARQFAREADVVLAVPNAPALPVTDFRVVRYRPWSLFRLVRAADVVICQGFRIPLAVLQLSGRIVVVDLYDPVPLELVEHYRDAPRRDAFLGQELAALRLGRLCRLGDAFLVTGERQRDFWLGALAAAGRLNWDTAGEDPLLRRLVMEVPFGLPSEPPQRTGRSLRQRWPSLRDGDRILLWGGGVWNWLDPLTVIRAVGQVAAKRDDVKLVFMGVQHPNPRIGALRMVDEAVALAKSLELYDRHVFFNFGWTSYEARQDALLDADVGVCAHPNHLEARFAFRTRLLDYLWAGLPILATRGDDLAEEVRARGIGLCLEPGDVDGWATAILRLVEDRDLHARCRAQALELAGDLTWERTTANLRAFCRAPGPAADRRRRTGLGDVVDLVGYGISVGCTVIRYGSATRVWRWLRTR
jgi:glycosyltransferase involved in cell wall biosynthesis